MATIKDVAALANVSYSTVSRALSGKTPVDEETRRRVLDAVEKLGYRPNMLARGLKNAGTHMIALVIPNINNLIYPAVAMGVEEAARNRGYNVILCNTNEKAQIEKDYIRDLSRQWIDGVILALTSSEQMIMELSEKNVPVVLLFRGVDYPIDQVLVRNKKGACEMVRYLIERGAKKIAIVNGRRELTLYKERYEGYVEALKEAGIRLDRNFVLELDGESDTKACEAVTKFLKAGYCPDAIFAASDPLAWGTMRAVKEAGFRIPEDISVAGFDNLVTSGLLTPSLTTMTHPFMEMGMTAANRLIDIIENKSGQALKPELFKLDATLIVRGSTK